jgi:hypothetical protein
MAKIKAPGDWTRVERDAAKAILLEPSPYDADGGELIGRDPRKIAVEEFSRAGLDSATAMEIIRAKCLDCCAGQEAEVRKCVAIACPNWPYRMGANPFHKRELSGEQRAAMAERIKATTRRRKGDAAVSNDDILSSSSSPDDPPGQG